ncbi:MAG: family 78 glycoside hydrolase catalytic domain [Microbacterium sp.]
MKRNDVRRLIDLHLRPGSGALGIDQSGLAFAWTYAGAWSGDEVVDLDLRERFDDRVVWSASVVASDAVGLLAYTGPSLRSGAEYEWTLRSADVVTSGGFETGLLDESAWLPSRWIGRPEGVPQPSTQLGESAGSLPDRYPAPLLSRGFDVPDGLVRRARLYVAAGGYARVLVNGKRPDDTELSPGFTNYDRRVQYTVVDIGPLLLAGENRIEIELGRGFYAMTTKSVWNWHEAPWRAEPAVRALALIELDDQLVSLPTDESWEAFDTGVLRNSLYSGETIDMGGSPRLVGNAIEVEGPRGRLVRQPEQPIRRIQAIGATACSEPRAGVSVFSFGRTISGWARLLVEGRPGDVVSLRYGEKLNHSGEVGVLDVNHVIDGDVQVDRFILGQGRAEHLLEPCFSYKGFRYVEVSSSSGTARISEATAIEVRTDVRQNGRLSTSDPGLDWIFDAAVRTFLNNVHSIPTDTPLFEKNGWTADAALFADSALFATDSEALFTKYVVDIRDSLDADGVPLHIAPSSGWGGGAAAHGWHAALLTIPWSLYMRTGDRSILRDAFPAIATYLRFEYQARSTNGIAPPGLGDWHPPKPDPSLHGDTRVENTAYLYRMLRVGADIAQVLGNGAEASLFRGWARVVRSSFTEEFLDRAAGVYRGSGDVGYRQTHNVLPLAFGMVPREARPVVEANLVADIERRDGHLWTGVLGTKYILRVLSAAGRQDLAHHIATVQSPPGWGHWRAAGSDTLWEAWTEPRSLNHYFFGTAVDWLIEDVVGLRPVEAGFRSVAISPSPPSSLDSAELSTVTGAGRIDVQWSRDDSGMELSITAPPLVQVNVRAEEVLKQYAPAFIDDGRSQVRYRVTPPASR